MRSLDGLRRSLASARVGNLWLTGLIVLADQVTKPLVGALVPLHESVPVMAGFLSITHVRNTGAAFGMLNSVDFPFKSLTLIAASLVALAGLGFYAASLPPQHRLARAGLALILGGAIGNLIDRARLGYVLDFIDVYWRNHHFWAFNVADSAITVGAAALILELLLDKTHHASDPV